MHLIIPIEHNTPFGLLYSFMIKDKIHWITELPFCAHFEVFIAYLKVHAVWAAYTFSYFRVITVSWVWLLFQTRACEWLLGIDYIHQWQHIRWLVSPKVVFCVSNFKTLKIVAMDCMAIFHGNLATLNSLRSRDAYICITKLDHHWFGKWFISCSASSHYLNRIIVNWPLANIFQWNFNQTTAITIEENTFEKNAVCKMVDIFYLPQWVNP